MTCLKKKLNWPRDGDGGTSIRANAGDATNTECRALILCLALIHTSIMGCDKKKRSTVFGWYVLQSMHPRRVRQHASVIIYPYVTSIHALTWSATFIWQRQGKGSVDFNPHNHQGCNIKKNLRECRVFLQSTHPRGIRPPAAADRRCSCYFNPRIREGCD